MPASAAVKIRQLTPYSTSAQSGLGPLPRFGSANSSATDLPLAWSSTTLGSGQSVSNQALCGALLPVFWCTSAPVVTARLDSDPQGAPTWTAFAATTDYSPAISGW